MSLFTPGFLTMPQFDEKRCGWTCIRYLENVVGCNYNLVYNAIDYSYKIL